MLRILELTKKNLDLYDIQAIYSDETRVSFHPTLPRVVRVKQKPSTFVRTKNTKNKNTKIQKMHKITRVSTFAGNFTMMEEELHPKRSPNKYQRLVVINSIYH